MCVIAWSIYKLQSKNQCGIGWIKEHSQCLNLKKNCSRNILRNSLFFSAAFNMSDFIIKRALMNILSYFFHKKLQIGRIIIKKLFHTNIWRNVHCVYLILFFLIFCFNFFSTNNSKKITIKKLIQLNLGDHLNTYLHLINHWYLCMQC